jgi:phosphohistidine phosphatase
MLTLMLLRHAKSSWDHPGLDDFSRPLAPRGIQAAPRMGAFIADNFAAPNLVLCSAALRTRATLDFVLPHLQPSPDLVFEDELYLASASELQTRLRRVPPRWPRVLMIGHNPGFHDFAQMLTGSAAPDDRLRLIEKYPTAGLAVLTFEASTWSRIGPGRGTLTHFVTPAMLMKGRASA